MQIFKEKSNDFIMTQWEVRSTLSPVQTQTVNQCGTMLGLCLRLV